jgi:hypothetical protein
MLHNLEHEHWSPWPRQRFSCRAAFATLVVPGPMALIQVNVSNIGSLGSQQAEIEAGLANTEGIVTSWPGFVFIYTGRWIADFSK